MSFVDYLLIVVIVFGIFCGVNQGRNDIRREIKRIKERKEDEKRDAVRELESALSDENKKIRSKRERLDIERLGRQVGQLGKEIVWIEKLLSEISS